MPEDVKLMPHSAVDDSLQESPLFEDDQHYLHERDSSRSESSSMCSDELSCYKQNGHESVEIIPTRTTKTALPKPAANPLQFVKIGPCELYRSAQQQLQKVSEVKKPKKEVKDEIEDWQSNLDSWKCNRRKQQEHIIERVVEVKKLELEEHDRNRKRTKTFNEMMEERTSKGRKLSLPLYLDDNDDLSDLGLSSNKNSIKSPTIPEEIDVTDEASQHRNEADNVFNETNRTTQDKNETTTYESAILSYETRMKSLTNGECKTKISSSMTAVSNSTSSVLLRKFGRRGSTIKIEEKLSELERIKNRSVSSTDLTEMNKKQINIPKVNIFQRKEVFEKINDVNESAKNRKLNDELPRVRSIKERLSSLEKHVEETVTEKSKNVLVTEVSVKDRLSSINEKMRRQSTTPEKASTKERVVLTRSSTAPVVVDYEKERKSEEYGGGLEAVATTAKTEEISPLNGREYNSSGRSSSSEEYEHVHQVSHFHHRSLDSLQGNDSPNGFCFERVQSLECIDCCSNYPASVLSGDTDREDSGIHTADVSSSVSQADDFDLHADSSMDAIIDVKSAIAACEDGEPNVDKSSHEEFHLLSQTGESVKKFGKPNDDNQKINRDVMNESMASVDSQTHFTSECELHANHFEENQNDDGVVKMKVLESRLLVDAEVRSQKSAPVDNMQKQQESLVLAVVNENCIRGNERATGYDSPERRCSVMLQKTENECNENNFEKSTVKFAVDQDSLNGSNAPQVSQNFVEDELEYLPNVELNLVEHKTDDGFPNNGQFEETLPNGMLPVGSIFAFESSTAVEPPKEKPPPPPTQDNSDDDAAVNNNVCLRRMDSTKRIKKEIRQKRSSFLGIEGYDNDSYLEPKLELVKRPPDMISFLQEERRLQKLLYRQSICSESDSTQGESRDSGVESDKNLLDENIWITDDTGCQHDSEAYTNTNIISEEDEIKKKEREILEILELEEQRNCESESKNGCTNNLGEKLVLRLKELERQKNICWNRNEEQLLQVQPDSVISHNYDGYSESIIEAKKNTTDNTLVQQQPWTKKSVPIVNQNAIPIRKEYISKKMCDYRNSMPNMQQEVIMPNPCHRVPPPIPPNKPTHLGEQSISTKLPTSQQMSKQTLQALSAVPRSKIVDTDSWVQSKKKSRHETYNYQHWLIQEAEHRRITEQQQRNVNASRHNNYINVHTDYSETTAFPNHDTPNSEGCSSGHSNKLLYTHPQMLPQRNHNHGFVNDRNSVKSYPRPLPDSVIQTLTQRVQNRFAIHDVNKYKRKENFSNNTGQQEKLLSVSGKKKCSHCGEELGRGAAMIIESLRLFYHIDCFKCCVCCVQLGDGLMGTDVRVRNSKLHCHSCYSNDEGLKFSCV